MHLALATSDDTTQPIQHSNRQFSNNAMKPMRGAGLVAVIMVCLVVLGVCIQVMGFWEY